MEIKQSFKTGLGFGLTSGVITTLGLIVGLSSGTHSKEIVLSGILVIAVADAFSDALGIHISEESDSKNERRQIWESTFSTFASKFLVALTFAVPILALPLSAAMVASVLWGLALIGVFSFYLAVQKKKKPARVILEHLIISVLVIVAAYYIGDCL